MSRNERRIVWPLLVAVFVLSGGLMFAFGPAPILYFESGGRSISAPILGPTLVSGRANRNDTSENSGSTEPLTQRNFNRHHDMTVEMISVGPEGFEPTSLTRPGGRFLLAINNRSGLEELSLQLIREDGKLMQQARVNRKRPNWRSIVNLPAGAYRLTETTHADWVCRIVISSNP